MAVKPTYVICEEDMKKAIYNIEDGTTTIVEDTDPPRVITPEETAAKHRNTRNGKLANTDWTQMPDYNGSDKTAWATYRQDLRDVPQQETFPTTVIWPEEPGA